MKPKFVYTHSTIVEPSIEDLAQMVVMLDAVNHATLISLVAQKIRELGGWSAMQLQYITNCPELTADGRSLMSQIGNYAHALPLPEGEALTQQQTPAPAPAPAVDKERVVIAAKPRSLAPQNPLGQADAAIIRTAELLQQCNPAPVRASERPWEREGWLDQKGRCWMEHPGNEYMPACWQLCKPSDRIITRPRSLPHWAIPIPVSTDAS